MASAGDQVSIICDDTTYEGTLMPRPELLSSDILVLKLGHGYNIGIDKKRIKETNVVKKYSPSKKTSVPPNHKKGLPTVALVSCGGTISSRVDYYSGGVSADYTASDFLAMCPELTHRANITAVAAKQLMSEDITPHDWMDIARSVKKAIDDGADGVVVTHGTDTLHYTATMLSYLLKNLNKPVVITGAQRSIDRPSSDAFMNLTCSVIAASSKQLHGVMTCLHGESDDRYCLLIPGTKVRKMHTSRRDAFRPINASAIGKVYPTGKIVLSTPQAPPPTGPVTIEGGFEAKTGIVLIHPGISPDLIEHFVEQKYRGLVVSATALGHVPTGTHSLIPSLKKAVDSGMVVVISSQTLYGRVHPHVYTNLRKLSLSVGATFVEDLHPEAAYCKLGWALSQSKDHNHVKRILLNPLQSDISTRSVPFDAYLS